MTNTKACLWKVYIHINKVNNKSYVGITKRCVNRRFYEHSKSNSVFGNAIRKYGNSSWISKILHEVDNINTALALEAEEILKYDSIVNGYNLSESGTSGNYGWKASKDFCNKLSMRMKESNPMHNKDTVDKIRQYHIGSSRSSLTKEKMSISAKNRKYASNYTFYTPWGTFSSIRDAANIGVLSKSTIRRYCSNPNKIITKSMISGSNYLDDNMIGKSLNDIGFGQTPSAFTPSASHNVNTPSEQPI